MEPAAGKFLKNNGTVGNIVGGEELYANYVLYILTLNSWRILQNLRMRHTT